MASDTSLFDSAVRMEEGRAVDNASSELAADESLMSLSRRISELEDAILTGRSETGPNLKLTPSSWRLLISLFLLAPGLYKAAATYGGHSTAPTTLDWIIGVLGR